MNVLLVSGFLGSGKTTLILALACQMVEVGSKIILLDALHLKNRKLGVCERRGI